MGKVVESYQSFSESDGEEGAEMDSDEMWSAPSEEELGMDDGGRLRMRPDIEMGPEYAGKLSSRKKMLGDDDDGGEDLDDSDEERSRLDGNFEALFAEKDSGDDEQTMETWRMDDGQDNELHALSKEYEKLRQQELELRESLKDENQTTYRKGEAVRNQKNLWDSILETRISLQKVLSGANRLPKKPVKDVLSENTDVMTAYSRLATSAAMTLNCLLNFEMALKENNEGIEEMYAAVEKGTAKRKATSDPITDEGHDSDGEENAWKLMDSNYSRLAPFRDNALDRWQRKVQLTAAVASRGRLRAFNQSISQQIAAAMRDTSRLISGTQVQNSSLRILGETHENADIKVEKENEQGKENAVNPETFDDLEFYQNLLHEFLESADPMGQGKGHPFGLRKRIKNRKIVDRRASKGRKIRYNVMNPLLNFMAPLPMTLPPMAEKLFSNVFGRSKVQGPASWSNL